MLPLVLINLHILFYLFQVKNHLLYNKLTHNYQ